MSKIFSPALAAHHADIAYMKSPEEIQDNLPENTELVFATNMLLPGDELSKQSLRVAVLKRDDINETTGSPESHLIISCAGTDFGSLDDLKADGNLVLGNIPKEEVLSNLAKTIALNIPEVNDPGKGKTHIHLVGHSLGSTIAELIPIILFDELKQKKIGIEQIEISCTTFENPGCKKIFNQACKKRGLDPDEIRSRVIGTTYNASDNIINTLNDQNFDTIKVYTKDDKEYPRTSSQKFLDNIADKIAPKGEKVIKIRKILSNIFRFIANLQVGLSMTFKSHDNITTNIRGNNIKGENTDNKVIGATDKDGNLYKWNGRNFIQIKRESRNIETLKDNSNSPHHISNLIKERKEKNEITNNQR